MATSLPSTSDTTDQIPDFDTEDAIEQENTGVGDLIKPWDPKQIRITTKTFTIREIFNQIEDDDIDLAPDFQRSFVWNQKKQVLLIESILLGIPLPAFYFNQDSTGSYQVIDGVQRLTTIKNFMSGQLTLHDTHLEYLKDLKGHTYDSLDAPVRRRFSGTQIVAHVIEPQTPDEVKFDIFNRVNTGGSPLEAQEIRHCMSKDVSRRLLISMVERPSFDRATAFTFWTKGPDGTRIRHNRRMADRELALRFCAFRSTAIAEYERASSLDGFLLDFTRRIDREFSLSQITDLEEAFERSMINCGEILGDAAFRRWAPDAPRRGPINRAVFESQALALAEHPRSALLPYRDKIVAAFRNLFNDETYDAAVRFGTGDPRKVERRLAAPKKLLKEIIG